MEPLDTLQGWYASCCDGDWEHTFGVKIDTLDNSGWTVEIDLTDTSLENKSFTPVHIDRTEDDWIRCEVSSGKFRGWGTGPRNLTEILRIFSTWSSGSTMDAKG